MNELTVITGALMLLFSLYSIVTKLRVAMKCEKVKGVVIDLHPKLGNPYTVDAICKIKYKGYTYNEKARINMIIDTAKVNKEVYFYVKPFGDNIKFIGSPSLFLLPILFFLMSISVIIIGMLS